MKLRKLNARGFSHEVLVIAFVVIFAIAGVGYIVASHADASSGPNTCTVQELDAGTAPKPANNTLAPLYVYHSVTNDDYYLTLVPCDGGLGWYGYTSMGVIGYAFINPQPSLGTVALNSYVSQKLGKHFYTTAPFSSEPDGFGGFVPQPTTPDIYVLPISSNGSVYNTTALYRYVKSDNAHYYWDNTALMPPPPPGFTLDAIQQPQAYIWKTSQLTKPVVTPTPPKNTPVTPKKPVTTVGLTGSQTATTSAKGKKIDGGAGLNPSVQKDGKCPSGDLKVGKSCVTKKEVNTGKVQSGFVCTNRVARWAIRIFNKKNCTELPAENVSAHA